MKVGLSSSCFKLTVHIIPVLCQKNYTFFWDRLDSVSDRHEIQEYFLEGV